MQDKAPDRILGELAVSENMISSDELEAAFEAQRFASRPRPIGEIMLEMQLITTQQFERLLEVQRQRSGRPVRKFPTNLSELFGHLAMERGYATLAQVDECLAEQKRLESEGQQMRLGQIMVRKHHLTTEQFLEILRLQEEMTRTCPKCGENLLLSEEESRSETTVCRKCGAAVPVAGAAPKATPLPQIRQPAAALAAADTVPLGEPILSPQPAVRLASTPRPVTPMSPGPALGPIGPPLPKTPFPASKTPGPTEGKPFGRYRLLQEIGKGGMGVVYRALDVPLNRIVALKLLRAADAPDASHVMRFVREAKMAARLSHPAIVTVHEVGTLEDAHYFTMEFIEGQAFDKLLGDKRLSREHALEILEKVARAVDYAHSCGVVHRDLKPGNVMIDRQGQPRITDFGLAKPIALSLQVTQEGTAVGTPYYMSPEQVRGNLAEVDARSDIYGLGVMLYEILVGEVPYKGTTASQIYDRILNADAVRPREVNPDIPQELETVILRAMEREKALRYPSAGEFADDLRRFLNGEPVTAKKVSTIERVVRRLRRSWVLGAGVALLAVAAAVAILLVLDWRSRREREALRRQAGEKVEAAEQLLADFRRALPRDPAPKLKEKAAEVSAKLDEAFAIDPSCARAFEARGHLRRHLGDLGGADEDFTRAVAEDASLDGALLGRAKVRLRQYMVLRGRPLAVVGRNGEILEFNGRESASAKEALDRARQDFGELEPRMTRPEDLALVQAAAALLEGKASAAADLAPLQSGDHREEAPLLRILLAAAQNKPAREILKEFDAALALRHNLSEASELHAMTPFSKGEIEWAVKQLDREIEQTQIPSADRVVERTLLRMLLRDFAGARRDAEAALKASASYPQALETLVLAWLAEGDRASAAGAADAFAKAHPQNPRALLMRALVRLEREDDLDGALKDAEAALKQLPQDLFAAYVAARAQLTLLQDATQLAGAEKLCSEAEAVLKGFYHVIDLRAEARHFRERYRALDDIEQRCLKLRADYWRAYQTRGRIKTSMKQFGPAIEDFEKALKLNPESVLARQYLGFCRLEKGDTQPAIDEFGAVLKSRPDMLLARLYRGYAYARLRDRKRCFEDLDEVRKKNPGHPMVALYLAQSHYELEEYEEAIAVAKQGKTKFASMAEAFDRVMDASQRRLKEATDWMQYLRRGQDLCLQQRKYPEARREYQRGFMLMPPGYVPPSPDVGNYLMVCQYNYACTISVTAKDRPTPEERQLDATLAVHTLDRALRSGFATMLSGACDGNAEPHAGYEHMLHDSDFESIRQDAGYLKLVKDWSWVAQIRQGNAKALKPETWDEARKLLGEGLSALPADFAPATAEQSSFVLWARFTYTRLLGVAVSKAATPEERRKEAELAVRAAEELLKAGFAKMLVSKCSKDAEAHSGYQHLTHDPEFEALRQEPAFRELLEKHRPKEEY